MTTVNVFSQLLALDVRDRVEKKDKYSYLSWPYAVAEMRKVDPSATWDVIKFPLPDHPHILAPYCITPAGCFVEVAVTCGGVRLPHVHPVLDQRNKAIAKPSADEVNKSIMRCLVKAIALHGVGLHIYAGEDLPLGDGDEERAPPKKQEKQEQKTPPPSSTQKQEPKATAAPKAAAADEKRAGWERWLLRHCSLLNRAETPEDHQKVLGEAAADLDRLAKAFPDLSEVAEAQAAVTAAKTGGFQVRLTDVDRNALKRLDEAIRRAEEARTAAKQQQAAQ